MVHVSLDDFQCVLLYQSGNQTNAFVVGSHLCLEVTEIVVEGSGATDVWNAICQLCRGHQQLCNALLLHSKPGGAYMEIQSCASHTLRNTLDKYQAGHCGNSQRQHAYTHHQPVH
jgi:hypothetical protein